MHFTLLYVQRHACMLNYQQRKCLCIILCMTNIIWYQQNLGSKQAYYVVHQPVSRGLAVFADAWLSGWLAEISADLRETVAHQRWFHDDALYKSTTLLCTQQYVIPIFIIILIYYEVLIIQVTHLYSVCFGMTVTHGQMITQTQLCIYRSTLLDGWICVSAMCMCSCTGLMYVSVKLSNIL